MTDISIIEEEFAKWESQQYAGNSKEKRTKLAQFFTPAAFAKALIDKLGPLEDKDILDPCLGSGNLIAAAVLSGADPKRCYGIELDETVFEVAKKRLAELGVPEGNLVCGSALEQSSYAKKFDCIVMNPPYQRNLHLKILAEAIKYLKDEKSVCVNLSPVRWLQDPLAKYKKNCDLKRFEESVAKHIENLDVFFAKEMSDTFQIQIKTDLGVYKCSKEKHSFESDNVPNASGKNIFLIRKIYEKITSKNLSSVEDQLVEFRHKTSSNYVTVSTIGGVQQRGIEHETHSILRGNNYGPFVDEKYNSKTIHEIKTANKLSVWGDVGNWPVVCFSTGDEAINFYGSQKTKFMMFLAWAFSSDQHVPNWAMPFLGDAINPRTGKKGYTGEWTDDDLYRFFNITLEEQKVIEETMKKYKKKKLGD